MKIWTNDTFDGHYPVGSAAIVIAHTAEDAAKFLETELITKGLKQEVKPSDMTCMLFSEGIVKVLADGNY